MTMGNYILFLLSHNKFLETTSPSNWIIDSQDHENHKFNFPVPKLRIIVITIFKDTHELSQKGSPSFDTIK